MGKITFLVGKKKTKTEGKYWIRCNLTSIYNWRWFRLSGWLLDWWILKPDLFTELLHHSCLIQWNLDLTILYVTNNITHIILVIIQYMEDSLDITKSCYNEHILPVPWLFVISRFHFTSLLVVICKNTCYCCYNYPQLISALHKHLLNKVGSRLEENENNFLWCINPNKTFP